MRMAISSVLPNLACKSDAPNRFMGGRGRGRWEGKTEMQKAKSWPTWPLAGGWLGRNGGRGRYLLRPNTGLCRLAPCRRCRCTSMNAFALLTLWFFRGSVVDSRAN
ncbi:hypothetical protein FA95DRAFT_108119 [Auriscalpium vulgare]|uniref:Uncharacterized protein n=1 Tax=Auriscalpium vulgare TaxID=40419 RepID=A0ACB8S756_9AGAM|nr:hypothetical protein FA95DRAFT_108119 [Auriscalpium vulgare]